MSLPVRVLPRAGSDFRQIYTYIERRSISGAQHWREAFEKAMEGVARRPESGGLAPEDALTHLTLRQTLFRTKRGLTYRAVYAALEEELVVLRIRGPGQPPLAADEIPGV